MTNDELERLVIQRTSPLEAANKELSVEIEKRKKAEEKLLKEHEVFLKIFSTVPVGLLLLDSNTAITHANKAIYSMVLREPSEVIGLWAGGGLGCVHSLETPKGCGFSDSCPACPLRHGIEQIIAERTHTHGSELNLTMMIDGKLEDRCLSVSAESIDIEGNLQVIVAIDDITDRKRIEQALKESEKRLSTILETEPECIKILDLEGKLVYINPAGLNMIDADNLEQVVGQPILPLIASEYRKSFGELVTKSINGGGGKLEFEVVGLKGRHIWLETNSVPLRHLNEEVTGVLSITRDITERKLYEEKIEESKKKYRGLSEATFEAIFISEKGMCIEQNLSARKMFGYTDEEAFGKIGTEWLTPEDREMVINNMIKGYEKPYEATALRKDGTTFPCMINGRMMHYKGKDVRVTALSDITESKKAEIALEESKKQLIELNANKDKFFSIIAHDLRSPFNSILGFSDIMVEQVKKKDYVGVEKYAAIIQNSSQHAMKLLLNLFEWAQLQTRRLVLNPEYFEMVSLVNEVAELTGISAQQKNISISSNLPHNATVFADKSMISTVLRNLVSNAIKFTHLGGKIVITVEQKKKELIISVSDTGIGISNEVLEKLFLLNETVSMLGTNNEKGTGLGLILCKEFVEKNKGKIWVESEVGKGSVFYFTLPL